MDATVALGQQGRVVTRPRCAPTWACSREALHLHVEGERLVLERPGSAAARLRGLARAATGRSLLEELLAERRAEVAAS